MLLAAAMGGAPALAQAPSPGVRMGAVMVYDASRAHVVAFGGRRPGRDGFEYPNDFWAWDGRAWRELVVPGEGVRPRGRDAPHLAYEADRRRVVMFGGRRELPGDVVQLLSDVWEWDGARWHEMRETGLEPVVHAVAAYDPVRRRVVMYGGLGITGFSRAVREWDGTRWLKRDSAGPPTLTPGGVTMSPAGEMIVIGTTPTPDSDPVPPPSPRTWTFAGSAWREAEVSPSFANLQPVVGLPDGTLWVYQAWERWVTDPIMHVRHPDGRWTVVAAGAGPGVRMTIAATYDAARRRMVLYGGRDRNGFLGDTWEFDGRAWERR